MLSPSDTAIVFLLALLLFGPEQLPKLARQLGEAMRHIQSTTQSFMLEMERAAQASEEHAAAPGSAGDGGWAAPDPGPPADATPFHLAGPNGLGNASPSADTLAADEVSADADGPGGSGSMTGRAPRSASAGGAGIGHEAADAMQGGVDGKPGGVGGSDQLADRP